MEWEREEQDRSCLESVLQSLTNKGGSVTNHCADTYPSRQ